MAETNMPEDVRFYPQLERAIAHYPYDPRQAEQLMGEAGFAKDSGGRFATAQGERFRPEFWVISGPLYEKQQLIMHDTWTRAGIDSEPRVMNAAQLRDFAASVTFSGLSNRLLQPNETQMLNMYTSAQIGSPANRWLGNNRNGWSSQDYDRLFDAYAATLDRAERDRQIIEMMKLTADQLPVLPTYFNIEVMAHLASIRGPALGSVDRLVLWNVHEWEML
jgi:peptide/nickel transport system substrate-binding protein